MMMLFTINRVVVRHLFFISFFSTDLRVVPVLIDPGANRMPENSSKFQVFRLENAFGRGGVIRA
jgi:hypothetical protein